ncbi:NADH-cytochrome b5 reductase-like isoform X1 [Corticium candelabrum]|uniref:NADH-cytochrome b5 reductase-like isoform X1 n=1 Tax=Corticium candelabrum TaxID=121492 RepID=UPI002E27212D|nr:NADH-cytochrome b5 reductase-like isoform X1 [Corticium candelabrum]
MDNVASVACWMRPEPHKPEESECCGSGCVPCVFDVYEQEMSKWREEVVGGGRHVLASCTRSCLSPLEFRHCELVKIKQESHDTWRYAFRIPHDGSLNLKMGQHIVLRAVLNGDCIVKSYTPVSPLEAKGYFEVIIKLYETGLMSRCIKTWQVGRTAEWKGPFGDFPYVPNKYKHVGMLAAGTGITPLYQVARGIVNNEEDETFIRLIYACRTAKEVLLKEELDQLAEFWNFRVVYALSQDPGVDQISRYGDIVVHGRITAALVSTEMPPSVSGTITLVCGTSSFNKDMIIFLRSMGYIDSMYFKF